MSDQGTEGDFRGTTPIESRALISGAGGIRTRDPHTASVMRSHCATAPIVLRSSTLITDVTPAPARTPTGFHLRSSRASSAPAPVGLHCPPTLSTRLGRLLLPIEAVGFDYAASREFYRRVA